MREIKFRGRSSKDNATWFTGSFVSLTDIDEAYIEHFDGLRRMIERYPVDPATVGQYTGLRDADGRQIYEGDIVRFNDELGLVVWRAGEFDIDLQSGPCCIGALACLEMPFGDDDFNKIHVIGNVHDNPDLVGIPHDQSD